MEYNELLEYARQQQSAVPDADSIVRGVHRTLQVRRQRQRLALAAVLALLLGASATLPLTVQADAPATTLAERVSAHDDTPHSDLPPTILGYQHSLTNRKIQTLI